MPNPLLGRLPVVLAGSAAVLLTASGGALAPRHADSSDFGDSDTNGAWCVHRVDQAPVALSGLVALQAVSWALASPACQSAGDLT